MHHPVRAIIVRLCRFQIQHIHIFSFAYLYPSSIFMLYVKGPAQLAAEGYPLTFAWGRWAV
jgi:hypothetical protein